jgi:hypothetical protein
MPSGERALSIRAVSSVADLDEETVEMFWRVVEASMTRVFAKSDKEARNAVLNLRQRMLEESREAALLFYHDSPLQIASILAGAAYRPLTDEELLAYDKIFQHSASKDRPSQEQLLRVHRPAPKAG